MAAPVEPLTYLAQEVRPRGAVCIVTIDGLGPMIAARGDVGKSTGERDAKGSGHELSLAGRCWDARYDPLHPGGFMGPRWDRQDSSINLLSVFRCIECIYDYDAA